MLRRNNEYKKYVKKRLLECKCYIPKFNFKVSKFESSLGILYQITFLTVIICTGIITVSPSTCKLRMTKLLQFDW